MLILPAGFRIWLAVEPVDLRKQGNGLWALAEQRLKEDPRRGAAFVFTNPERQLGKILYWDGNRSRTPIRSGHLAARHGWTSASIRDLGWVSAATLHGVTLRGGPGGPPSE